MTEFDEAPKTEKPRDFLTGSFQDIPNRALNEDTCRLYGYQVGEHGGEACHIAPFYGPNGTVVAQKIRKAGKKFSVIGGGKDMPLFGMKAAGDGGRSIVITEGELDAMSVSQAFGNKWPAVSLPNGASSAADAIKRSYEWLDKFDKIILCFDQDEPGQKAVEDVLPLLPAGKAYIMSLPDGYKDANEVLVEQGGAPIVAAFWKATQWRPDGIKAVEELRDAVLNPTPEQIIPFPYSGLNDKLRGLNPGKLYTITSGSGLGKSTIAREITYDLLFNHRQAVGGMFLEESNEETIEYLMGIHLNKNISFKPELASRQELATAFDAVAKTKLYLWDHFGSQDIDVVLSKARYMVVALGVRWIVLDHLSILISGMEGDDERRTIDLAMTKLRSLCEETGVGMILISHLKRPQGDKGHEDGAEVRLGQLRGSHAIAQLSDVVIGLGKDPDNPMDDNLLVVVLKARKGGRRGPAGILQYDVETGRLTEFGL